MKKRLIPLIRCPQTGRPLIAFGVEVQRAGVTVNRVTEDEMLEEDDIALGVLVEPEEGAAYPIVGSVASLLCEEDVDPAVFLGLLERLSGELPSPFAGCVSSSIKRLRKPALNSATGKWNREEMAFFDRDVDTADLREAFAKRIESEPLWSRYVPREREIISHIRDGIAQKTVLEIGCGNARTVSWLLPPSSYNFGYVGTDISFKRLLLAKLVVPNGDFVQCSALKLPFVTGGLDGVLSFGVLHHLPDSAAGAREGARLVRSGGFFAFHEPIAKPRAMGGRLGGERENSRDGEINLDEVKTILEENGLVTHSLRTELSWAGTIMGMVIDRLPVLKARRASFAAAAAIDRCFIGSVSRLIPQTGPAGVLLVAVKIREG